MRITITINCDNDAFGDSPEECAAEVNAILRRLQRHPAQGSYYLVGDSGPVRDSNGNTVGFLTVEPE
jgi:hypothetical protein